MVSEIDEPLGVVFMSCALAIPAYGFHESCRVCRCW